MILNVVFLVLGVGIGAAILFGLEYCRNHEACRPAPPTIARGEGEGEE